MRTISSRNARACTSRVPASAARCSRRLRTSARPSSMSEYVIETGTASTGDAAPSSF